MPANEITSLACHIPFIPGSWSPNPSPWPSVHQVFQYIVLQSLSCVQLFATPWTAACLQSFTCPSPSSGACSNSCPLSYWCYPTILSSVFPFFCLQSFPIPRLDIFLPQFLNQSIVPCPVLTAASWQAYRFCRRQVKCFGIPISLRIFHSLLWST